MKRKDERRIENPHRQKKNRGEGRREGKPRVEEGKGHSERGGREEGMKLCTAKDEVERLGVLTELESESM